MNKIGNIKVVSIDLFRTLVDVDQSLETTWKAFLGEKYSDKLAKKYWARATKLMLDKLDEAAVSNEPFKNIRKIFEETYSSVFSEINLDYDYKAAAELSMNEHKAYNVFNDSLNFLEQAGERYPVCLSSDCDIEMITDIDKLFLFDYLFVSEILQSYKLNPAFFDHVINHYGTEPNNIIHIGDSKQDVLVPNQLGMLTCWLNRGEQEWTHDVRPDFEARSLLEVIEILGLNNGNREN